MVIAAMKLKDTCSLEEKLRQTKTVYLKLRHHFANKGHILKAMVFPVSCMDVRVIT